MSDMYEQFRKMLADSKPPKPQMAVWKIPDPHEPSGFDIGTLPIDEGHQEALIAIYLKSQASGGTVYTVDRPERPPIELKIESIWTPPPDMLMHHSFSMRSIYDAYAVPAVYLGGNEGGSSRDAYSLAREVFLETVINPSVDRFRKSINLATLIAMKSIEAYRVIETYAKAVTQSKHKRFRIERRLKRWWNKQVKQLNA